MKGSAQSFEDAYVSIGYLLGARGDRLSDGLPVDPGGTLVRRLCSPNQQERASSLAAQLLRLARSLMAERL
jgi:hypothetical protein